MMSITDDPSYRRMIEGYDTKLVVGTLTTVISPPSGPRSETFPLFLVDYHGAPGDMERFVADALDKAKKIELITKDGAYSVAVEERGTVIMVEKGETAAHTAPTFWAQYTPVPEEHEAFQREYSRLGLWMLMIITKTKVREILVGQDGSVIFKRVIPLTDELRKMLGVIS